MEQKLAYYEIKGQMAIVTIDHPPMNALDIATKEAIGEAVQLASKSFIEHATEYALESAVA